MKHVCNKSACNKGFILTSEALISLIVAASLLLLIPLTSSKEEARYSRLYHFQVLNDFFEAAAYDPGLGSALSSWASGGSEAKLKQTLDELHDGLGLCIQLESIRGKLSSHTCGEPTGDVVSTHRTIGSGPLYWRIDARLWAE